jgi:hypothetical protein
MIETSSRLDNYPFALASELRDAANEHGFRIGPEQASGWIFFRSASAPGEIAVAAAGNDGPFFLSITHSGVARELVLVLERVKGFEPSTRPWQGITHAMKSANSTPSDIRATAVTPDVTLSASADHGKVG